MIESKARLIDISKDYITGKFRLTFELDSFLPNMVDAIRDVCLRLSIKKWKEKRSLDANSFYWVLNSKMALALHTSPEELHEALLQRYGLLDSDGEGHISITVRSKVDMSRIDGHWKLYKVSRDGKWKSYLRIRGTSEYDTAEMSYFLERVIEEAQELGIDTETPNQKAEWEKWQRRKA